MPRKRKLIRCAEEKLIKNERKKHSKCTTNLPQSIEASAVENWMNQCKVFNSLRLFICKWPGRDTSPEITWQAWPGHTTTTHISHTNWDRDRERERLALCPMPGCHAYPVAKALTTWQALVYDLLEHLSLSLSRSERHKVSDAFACCPVWPLTYSLYDKSKSSSEKERKLEKIFSLCKFNGRMSQNFMSARGFFPFAHILFLFSFSMLFLSLCLSSSSTLCVIDRKL